VKPERDQKRRYQTPDHPWIDGTEAPLYVQALPAGGEDAELIAFTKAVQAWQLRVDFSFAVVFDISQVGVATATQRRILADHDKAVAEIDRKHCAGCAFVAKNSWQRGLITAAFWISPPSYPTKVFATQEEAKVWARARLQDASR
jgi:hypothetical protein